MTQSSTLPNDPNLFRGATGVVDTARNCAREQDREFVSWRLEATVKVASHVAEFPRLKTSHVPIRNGINFIVESNRDFFVDLNGSNNATILKSQFDYMSMSHKISEQRKTQFPVVKLINDKLTKIP